MPHKFVEKKFMLSKMSSSSTSKNYEIKKGPLILSICFAAKLLRKFKPFPQLPGKEHNRAISE